VELLDLDSTRPRVRYRESGTSQELRCDFIAGCDGSHGVARPSIPPGVVRVFERDYPFAWLGILAAVAPSTEELIYARHERGFALHSLRSPEVSRLYIQVEPDEDLGRWSDDRLWEELSIRLAGDDGFVLKDGPILEKSIAVHRSVVVEPMQYGRLFIAGDAAHIVPPTGAKGLNLAVADVRALAQGIERYYRKGDTTLLDRYTERCLGRVWRVQQFSSYMTMLFHKLPPAEAFQERLARAELDWVYRSEAASRSLAENYVGLPFD
jgi:p-hydroxybenzoate 3-monooxygenase